MGWFGMRKELKRNLKKIRHFACDGGEDKEKD
jgi:hypothetical protein